MFNIEFYSTADGTSELWNFLNNLQQKSVIWELRPGNNRVLYFYHKDDTYVFSTNYVRKHKKRRVVKLKRRRPNATTGFPEGGDLYGNLV